MYDPNENKMVAVDQMTPQQRASSRDWTRFDEGEEVSLKGVKFCIAEIGETRLVLRPVKKS